MSDHPQAGSRKAWYLLHSWSGIVLALMLYVVCASGSVALFTQELQLWQYPELQRVAPAPGGLVNVHGVLAAARQAHLVQDRITLRLPHHTNAVMLRLDDDSGRVAIFDPASGALLGVQPEGFARTLRVLHADLLLPFPFGTFFVGFLGIALLFLVLTGIVMHKRFYREAFTLRTGRSWRLSWSDLHKMAGSWGLVFLTLMGFTGSILGLAGLLFVQTAVVAHGGDRAAARSVIGGYSREAAGVPGALGDIGPMLANEIRGEPFVPRFLSIEHIGDAAATVRVEGERPDYLSDTDRKVFDRHGRLLATERGANEGAGWRVYSALQALHFGAYGDAVLKLVYLLLGVGACLLPISGILLWFERHRRANTAGTFHFLLRAMASGVIIGFPIACTALFLGARLAPGWMALEGNASVLLGSAWLGVLLWSLARARTARLEQGLLCVAGLLMLAVAPVNGWATGDFLLLALGSPLGTSHVVDAAMMAGGLSFLAGWYRLRRLHA